MRVVDMELNENRRQFYILKPSESETTTAEFESEFRRLSSITQSFSPVPVYPEELRSRSEASNSRSLEGSVLLVPSGGWAQGTLSDLTCFSDLEVLALVSGHDGPDRVGLWYVLGASMVLDQASSPPVLLGAISRLVDIEIQTLRPKLTKKEGLVFEILHRAGSEGVSRNQLSERIWGKDSKGRKTLDVHVFNLRRKLNSTRYRIVCRSQRFYLTELDAQGVEIAL